MGIVDKIEARLIAEWRQAWKFWSVRLNGLGITLIGVPEILSYSWSSMPADLREALPYAQHVAIGLFVASLVARIIKQPKVGGDGQD